MGDNVTIDGSASVGEILEIKGRNAVVAIGNFKSVVELSKLKHTIRKATQKTVKNTKKRAENKRFYSFSALFDPYSGS